MKKILTEKERDKIARIMRSRILNVLPAASYQMDKFLQLVDIVISDQTPSACVETGPQPRLHLNEGFISKYCQRDEHLLMLVLHELYHIILGHTRLFPRLTEAHNIAFDAIINALLCYQFPEPQYLEFFQNINNAKHFPSRLLRPPQGWPRNSKPPPRNSTQEEKTVMDLLYGKNPNTATYHEIFELLHQTLKSEDYSGFVLLGDHSGEGKSGEKDRNALNDDLFKEILRRAVEEWPDEAKSFRGRGPGEQFSNFLMPKPKSPRAKFLEALKRLLQKAGILHPTYGTAYAWKKMPTIQEYFTVIPNWRDRQIHSKEILLGQTPVLYKTEIPTIRPRWSPQNVAHVYLDVSGSMEDALPWLVGAINPLQRKGLCRIYAFSTIVDEIKPGRFLTGQVKNTYGTDINCVYEHLIKFSKQKTPQRVVVLTDGYTGIPKANLLKEWNDRKVELYVGLVGNQTSSFLQPYAKMMERMPNLN